MNVYVGNCVRKRKFRITRTEYLAYRVGYEVRDIDRCDIIRYKKKKNPTTKKLPENYLTRKDYYLNDDEYSCWVVKLPSNTHIHGRDDAHFDRNNKNRKGRLPSR